ncbi:amidohydrolase [Leifsonia sp. NPDC102414]|uniref:amidohydrolase n=1 Tax=Leifsonia sp. NPDC102414 TaxID=3364124 RepID=UPI00381A09A1
MSERFDLVIVAETVLTPDVIDGAAQAGRLAVAVRDGLIAGVAPEREARDAGWFDLAGRVVDAGDATVAAGFVDAHIHPVMGLRLTRGLDLSGITDRVAVRSAIDDYVASLDGAGSDAASGDWVLAWGLDPAVFDGGAFGNDLLDGVDGGRLLFITLFDGHSALASTAAVAAAGIRGDEVFPDASSLGLDEAGRPNGMLYEFAAQQLVLARIPDLTFDDRVEQLRRLLRGMAETGIVAGQMLDLMDPDSFDLFAEAERRGDLPISVRISPSLFPGFTDADLERYVGFQSLAGRRWHVRGVKLMIDGTIDNGTAWLFEPDTRGESTESIWLDPSEYQRAVRFFHERSIPTTTHAIGDKGISFVATTLGTLTPNGTQHRIEHIETLPDDVLDQIMAAGAAASMQPTHCTHYTRADHTDNWSQRLGDARAALAWRTRDLRERGAIVTLGSDWPIAPYDPRGILAAAQLRRPAGRPEIEPVVPDQALTARASLEGYTSEYWRSVGEAGGIIAVGMPADLTVFADDPLHTDPDAFAETAVLLTVVGGEVVVDAVALVDAVAPADAVDAGVGAAGQ